MLRYIAISRRLRNFLLVGRGYDNETIHYKYEDDENDDKNNNNENNNDYDDNDTIL